MSAEPIAQLELPAIEPTFSAREAAILLGRSYSWLDQRLRNREFLLTDTGVVQPLRTPRGYRRFTVDMIKDIALSSYHQGWHSFDELKSALTGLVTAAYRDTGVEIPG